MNIGPAEILVILVFALLIVGPDKLPKFGETLGKAINQFKTAQDKVTDTLKKEGIDPQSIREVSANPFLALEKLEGTGSKAESARGPESKSPEQESKSPEPKPDSEPAVNETFAQRKARLEAERDGLASGAGSSDAGASNAGVPDMQDHAAPAAADSPAPSADEPRGGEDGSADSGNRSE